MVHLELVAPADRGQQRRDGGLAEVHDALAPRAHQMVVMLGVAGDVRGDVSVPLEAAGHPVLDLRFERAVHRRSAEGRMACLDALVQLLRAERAPSGREGLRDEHPLPGEPPTLGAHPLRDLRDLHAGEDSRLTLSLMFPTLRPNLMKAAE